MSAYVANPEGSGPRVRDPRLDFFRGIGMFIIFSAHMPGNYWTLWIPARFGFSDATEIFVFCSGMASAIAFGRIFDSRGWLMGSARVMFRVWQVYWVHIGLFFAVALLMAILDNSGAFDKNYKNSLNLVPFFKHTQGNLIGLFSLTYVPNYFDILPMYLVILAMMPFVMALSRISLPLTGAVLLAIWLAANLKLLYLPAEPWSNRHWFFNPFGWQLVFFTGFAFMRGWIKPPPVTKTLIIVAIIVLLISVPFAYFRILREMKVDMPGLYAYYLEIKPYRNKSNFGILRYVHFLALAYLAWVAAGEGGSRLIAQGQSLLWRIWHIVVTLCRKVGQQSLAVFAVGMFAARLFGFTLDQIGRNGFSVALANLTGFALLILTAYTVAWFKSAPWRPAATAGRSTVVH